jgi:hypothetical protein
MLPRRLQRNNGGRITDAERGTLSASPFLFALLDYFLVAFFAAFFAGAFFAAFLVAICLFSLVIRH